MSESSLGSNAILDRTGNGNHLTNSGSQLTAGAAGKLTASVERTNSTSEVSRLITAGNLTIANGSSITILGWIYKTANTPTNGTWVWDADSGRIRSHSNSQTWRTYITSSTLLQISSGSVSNNTWHRSAVRHDSYNGLFSYIDGSNIGSDTSNTGGYIGTNNPLAIFQSGTANQPFIGRISHTFIATVDLGSDWIATDYNNQNSPSTFYSLGSEQVVTGNTVFIKLSGSFVEKPLTVF